MIIVIGSKGFIGKSFIKYVQDNYPNTTVVGISSRNLEELADISPPDNSHVTIVMCLGNGLQYNKNLPYQESILFERSYLNKVITILNRDNVKLIYLSSAGTIYKINEKQKSTENSELAPTSNYGMYKYFMENYLLNEFSSKVDSLNILRVSNVYGEFQKPNKGQGIISTLVNNILNNQEVTIFNMGLEQKDYLYIEDFSRALYLASNGKSSKFEYVYNVSSGNSYSVNQILELVKQILNKMQINVNLDLIKYTSVPDSGPLKSSFIDSNKFRTDYAWEPVVDLDNGLSRIIEYQKRTFNGN